VPTYGAILYKGGYPGIDIKFYGTNSELEYDVIVAPGADPSRVLFSYGGIEDLALTADGGLEVVLGDGSIFQKKPFIYQVKGDTKVEVKGWFVLTARNTYGFRVGHYDKDRPLVIDPGLVYSTYLRGSNNDVPLAITVDSSGNMYVTGYTTSPNFPTQGPFQATNAGLKDVFVTKLAPAGSSLVYSTYLGGLADDNPTSIAVDSSGNVYIAGDTESIDFPTLSPFQTANAGAADIFVARIAPAGDSLVYSTYIGGGSDDFCNAIALDSSGNLYIAGETLSSDIPVVNAFQGAKASGAGGADAYVAKLASTGGSLLYATYLGGTALDAAFAIAVDTSGNAYVAGDTDSADFPLQSPFQGYGGDGDAFIAKLSPTGSSLLYSTYLGGTVNEQGRGIAVDESGNMYVAGHTSSRDFPVQNAYQATHGGGVLDFFISKLTPDGASLLYSTYLGGDNIDQCFGMAVDPSGSVHVAGMTNSTNFPTAHAYQAAPAGGGDAVVAKLGPTGGSLAYATYLGGSQLDAAFALAIDQAGSVYVAGVTASADYPTMNPYQTAAADPPFFHTFVSKLGFTLSVSKSGTGTGTGTGTVTGSPAGFSCGDVCVAVYGPATAVTLAPVADTGSVFAGWTGCDPATGASSGKKSRKASQSRRSTQCIVTMTADKTVGAVFAASNYTLTATVSGSATGTLSATGLTCTGESCTGAYPYGSSVTLTATPDALATVSWIGCDSSTATTCTVSMTDHKSVTASFDGNCTYVVAPARRNFTPPGGSFNVTVTGRGSRNCATPSVRASDGWITASLASFVRTRGTARVTVAANGTTSRRDGAVYVAGMRVMLSQSGLPCSVTLTPTSAPLSAAAQSGSFSVVSPAGCAWKATVQSGGLWITPGDVEGTGNGTVTYSVPDNTSRRQRVGTIKTSLVIPPAKPKVFRVIQAR
jgi:hypothetical protein